MSKVLIYHCSDSLDLDWQWIAPQIDPNQFSWRFFTSFPKNFLERSIENPSLKRIRTAWQIVSGALKEKPALMVIHGPVLAFYVQVFASLRRLRIPTVIYSFNFSELPQGLKRKFMSIFFQKIDLFIVYSTMEKELYQKWFNLNPAKIEMVLWGVNPPSVENPQTPLVPGRYVSAIGGNARDYNTLIKAAKLLPHIPFVLVVRPENLIGLDIPPHVTVFENLSLTKTMNVLKFSTLMVLPLISSEIPCGHVTLVASMYLKVPFIITDSSGIVDYVHPGKNALTYPAGSISELKMAIEDLWDHPEKSQEMGNYGYQFVKQYCTEEAIVEHFKSKVCTKLIKQNQQT